jgi:hypothetical protein
LECPLRAKSGHRSHPAAADPRQPVGEQFNGRTSDSNQGQPIASQTKTRLVLVLHWPFSCRKCRILFSFISKLFQTFPSVLGGSVRHEYDMDCQILLF